MYYSSDSSFIKECIDLKSADGTNMIQFWRFQAVIQKSYLWYKGNLGKKG